MDNTVKKLLQERAALEADIKTQIGYFLENNPEVNDFELFLTVNQFPSSGRLSVASVRIKIEL